MYLEIKCKACGEVTDLIDALPSVVSCWNLYCGVEVDEEDDTSVMFMQWQTVCMHCENTQQTLDIKLYAALGIAVTNIGQPVPEDDTI